MRRTWFFLFLIVVAVQSAMGQEAGREPEPATPWEGGKTVISTSHPVTASGVLTIWRAYSTHGARVMLKVFRPEGDRLVLIGTSPLETVPAGEVATFRCHIPVSRNDLIGCYCPDATCVDRFDDGLVLVAEGDLGTGATSQFQQAAGEPALAAYGSEAVELPTTASTDLVVPVVARTPGLAGTFWKTSLELFNTSDEYASVALYLNVSGQDNTTPAATAQIELAPRQVLRYEDLLEDLFQVDQMVGSLDILSSQPLIAHARVANVSQGGTFGQTVPAVPTSWAAGADGTPGTDPSAQAISLFCAREDENWRSNLGITNISGVSMTFKVAALGDEGLAANPVEVTVPPYSHVQLNRVLAGMGLADGSCYRLTVSKLSSGAGRFFTYLSVVDNSTGDAVFILGSPEPALGGSR